MRFTLVLLLAIACSKKEPTPAPAAAQKTGEHDMEMPSELKAFHDVLAPRWHAEKGAQRMKDTCAAVPDFLAAQSALVKAPPAGANLDTWVAGNKALVGAIGELDSACKANDATGFEAAFQKVHEGFHVLLAAAGGEHEK
jgi:hypothetical protein